jgi:hypothetical protein
LEADTSVPKLPSPQKKLSVKQAAKQPFGHSGKRPAARNNVFQPGFCQQAVAAFSWLLYKYKMNLLYMCFLFIGKRKRPISSNQQIQHPTGEAVIIMKIVCIVCVTVVNTKGHA